MLPFRFDHKCLGILEVAASSAKVSSDLEFCVDNVVRFFGSGCLIAFVDHGTVPRPVSQVRGCLFNDSYI